MKEKIYMIPINDAYNCTCECPLCELRDGIETQTLEFYLGAAHMESDVRQTTNELGFCGDHLDKMYKMEINRLGLALMLHTHLLDIDGDIGAHMKRCLLAEKKGKDMQKQLDALVNKIKARTDTCAICKKIDTTMARYVDVLLWMYFNTPGFDELFLSKSRHCLPHTAMLILGTKKHLSKSKADLFLQAFLSVQKEGIEKMLEQLEWFTLKFDYRNKDKPWNDSKMAVVRTICLLTGQGISEGKGKKHEG